MERRKLSPPEQRNYEHAYEMAYKLAFEQLARLDIEQQCHRSGARHQATGPKKTITLEYLGQPCQIVLPDSAVLGEEKIALREKILILHYFIRARGTPLTGRIITYKELPEGVYFPTFHKRAVKPLLDHFGPHPERIITAAERLGGIKADYGDAAVTINAFRYVPVTLVLWRGDGEFAPEGNILFDSTIPDYLATEDITILAETISWRLVRYMPAQP